MLKDVLLPNRSKIPGDNLTYPAVLSIRNMNGTVTYKRSSVDTHRRPSVELGMILLGVMTSAPQIEERKVYRATYLHAAHMSVILRFAICTKGLAPEAANALKHEQDLHHDLLLLNCTETMFKSKTAVFFQAAHSIFQRVQYFAKVELNTFVHARHLAAQLNLLSSYQNIFYGTSCGKSIWADWPPMGREIGDGTEWFHCGGFYLLSKDLVTSLAPEGFGLGLEWRPEDQHMSEAVLHAKVPILNVVDDGLRVMKAEAGHSWQPLGLHSQVVAVQALNSQRAWHNLNAWLAATKNGELMC